MFEFDIAYRKYNNKLDIHGTVLYPAPMIAPIQNKILNELVGYKKEIRLLDPFHGSGIALYEAALLSSDFKINGFDINPLANLITNVKLNGINSYFIKEDAFQIKEILSSDIDFPIHDFPRIEKWFRKDVIVSLSKIKFAIGQIQDVRNRKYFWVIFTNVVRKYSNTRSSTYKLHIKKPNVISSIENNVDDDFLKRIEKNKSHYLLNNYNHNIKKCDSLVEMANMDKNSIDVLITSPPYGDNHTTVPYGQFSTLSIFWIDKFDLKLDGWEMNSYSAIDSMSMGGSVTRFELGKFEKTIVEEYTNRIATHKRKKVVRFLADYFEFLSQTIRITQDYIILTLGNRTVDGINISLTEVSKQYIEAKSKFVILKEFSREIPFKRIPRITSSVNSRSVSSMNLEYVLIFKSLTVEN